MHPTVAAFASPFLPFIRHAKSAPSCKAKTLANAQVFRPSTAEIYPLNSTKIQSLLVPVVGAGAEQVSTTPSNQSDFLTHEIRTELNRSLGSLSPGRISRMSFT